MEWRMNGDQAGSIVNTRMHLNVQYLEQKKCGDISFFKTVAVFKWYGMPLHLDVCHPSIECNRNISKFVTYYARYPVFTICKKNSTTCLAVAKGYYEDVIAQNIRETNISSDMFWQYSSSGYIRNTRSFSLGIDLGVGMCVSYVKNNVLRETVPAYKLINSRKFTESGSSLLWKINNFEDKILINKEADLTVVINDNSSFPVLAVHGIGVDGANITKVESMLDSNACYKQIIKYEKYYLNLPQYSSIDVGFNDNGTYKCLTLEENRFEVKTRTNNENQLFTMNKHTILVSKLNGIGIDITNETNRVCTKILGNNENNTDNTSFLFFPIAPSPYVPRKKGNMWEYIGYRNNQHLVNGQLMVRIHFVKFQNCPGYINDVWYAMAKYGRRLDGAASWDCGVRACGLLGATLVIVDTQEFLNRLAQRIQTSVTIGQVVFYTYLNFVSPL
ncbi:hypothetical protein HELRODRAFT_177788 [Helobdella robusta]|uniref:C-type lectin domain-containing protein n=1 Tax=Helobdella robusta TaxID=6412 RepID=T1FC98_HELRO|nr:hypothetical protein HELRODRAFT_177788 [Helobdella robusta]ESN97728.1 hypothetical protein HELRODRAFT_177788 [Helobdella robusta]